MAKFRVNLIAEDNRSWYACTVDAKDAEDAAKLAFENLAKNVPCDQRTYVVDEIEESR